MHIYKTLITLQFYFGHMHAKIAKRVQPIFLKLLSIEHIFGTCIYINDPFRDIVKSFHFENQHVILG